ncbi:hypothetical protein PIB30_090814 [Stylosanthes scabra]|uniref:Uncharacterized protein n=1 Tax=Stylosanthes scabra TaxID=79078 RepID=A0ABU6UTT2_9FABA|nr:hypothetical protein [Stylosanthes scabra]
MMSCHLHIGGLVTDQQRSEKEDMKKTKIGARIISQGGGKSRDAPIVEQPATRGGVALSLLQMPKLPLKLHPKEEPKRGKNCQLEVLLSQPHNPLFSLPIREGREPCYQENHHKSPNPPKVQPRPMMPKKLEAGPNQSPLNQLSFKTILEMGQVQQLLQPPKVQHSHHPSPSPCPSPLRELVQANHLVRIHSSQ